MYRNLGTPSRARITWHALGMLLLLLHLLLSQHTTHAVYDEITLDAWKIHTISSSMSPTHSHSNDQTTPTPTNSAERKWQISLASISSKDGDADLFVAHCHMSVDEVVSNYIGYSFTHGRDLIELPMYVVVNHLCAYVLGKSTLL